MIYTTNIVLKPGPARDPGPEPGRVDEKRGKKKPDVTRLTRRGDPATRLTRQDPVINPLTFVFFFLLKRRRFDFFLKN